MSGRLALQCSRWDNRHRIDMWRQSDDADIATISTADPGAWRLAWCRHNRRARRRSWVISNAGGDRRGVVSVVLRYRQTAYGQGQGPAAGFTVTINVQPTMPGEKQTSAQQPSTATFWAQPPNGISTSLPHVRTAMAVVLHSIVVEPVPGGTRTHVRPLASQIAT